MSVPARIEPGGFRELGPINWVIAKLGARKLGRRAFTCSPCWVSRSCCSWPGCRSRACLLSLGKLSRKDTELVILRVGHLRDCEYELQQHRRLAEAAGVGPELQAKIFEGPDAEGLTDRQRALITATDEFVITRGVSPETWAALSGHLSKPQLIEFCMLAAQYDASGRDDQHVAVTAGLSRLIPAVRRFLTEIVDSAQIHSPGAEVAEGPARSYRYGTPSTEGEQHRRYRQAQQERRPDIRLLLIPSPTHHQRGGAEDTDDGRRRSAPSG